MRTLHRTHRSAAFVATLRHVRSLVLGALGVVLAAGCVGAPDPDPGPLVDRLFMFTADDGEHGLEPWVSDGTPAGTRMLLDVVPGPDSGGDLIVWFRLGDAFVFSARSPDGSTFALYRTDGTEEGTVHVLDDIRLRESYAVHVGDVVVFDNDVPPGAPERGIFRTDGTAAGTVLISDDPDLRMYLGARVPATAVNLAHRASAAAVYGRYGSLLWRADGGGYTVVDDALDHECNRRWTAGVLGDVLFFPASAPFDDPNDGTPQDARCELWRYDTAGGGAPTIHRAFADVSLEQYSEVVGYAVRDGWLYYSLVVWEPDLSGPTPNVQVATYQLRATDGSPAPSDPLDDAGDRVVLGVDPAQRGFTFLQRSADEPIYLYGRSADSGGLIALMQLHGDPDDAWVEVVDDGFAGDVAGPGFTWLGDHLVYRRHDAVYAVANGSSTPVLLLGAPASVTGGHLLRPDWYDDRLFFWADEPGADGPVTALYVTDGTPAGTDRVATFCQRAYSGCETD
jgi:ELWxxDGT repeat protein